MQQETINRLVVLAEQAFSEKQSPNEYARTAAFHAASAAAHRYSPEFADYAAFLASESLVAEAMETQLYMAGIADAATKKLHSEQQYYAALRGPNESSPEVHIPGSVCTAIIEEKPTPRHFHSKINTSYPFIPPEKMLAFNDAQNAALYTCRHTYCVARSAYATAAFKAANTQNPALLLPMMSQRLNQDLKYDLIEPSFLLHLMCSTSLRVLAGLLFFGGAMVLLGGTMGVAGLPFIASVTAGSVSSTLSIGLFVGTIFAHKEKRALDEANDNREKTNKIA